MNLFTNLYNSPGSNKGKTWKTFNLRKTFAIEGSNCICYFLFIFYCLIIWWIEGMRSKVISNKHFWYLFNSIDLGAGLVDGNSFFFGPECLIFWYDMLVDKGPLIRSLIGNLRIKCSKIASIVYVGALNNCNQRQTINVLT